MAENKGVKLIRPIPQRSNPPVGIPQQTANPVLPLPSQNPLGAAPSNGLEGSLPIGSANLPINNFIYMLNRQNMPMTNTPGKQPLIYIFKSISFRIRMNKTSFSRNFDIFSHNF